MKTLKHVTLITFSIAVVLFLMPQISMGQDIIEHGPHFVDENGDGYNDNAPDIDGDGIPNGLDSDYTPANNGTGMRAGQLNENRRGFGVRGQGFIDENGDGFNDNAPDLDGDGIPNGADPDYVPLNNGSGNSNGPKHGHRIGAGNATPGDCNGTGIINKSSAPKYRVAK